MTDNTNDAKQIAAVTDSMLHHNRPPADLLLGDALRERLADENTELWLRADDLLRAARRIPEIEDEETAQKAGDFIKQLLAVSKAAEAARVHNKESYLEGGRQVDGWFKRIADPIGKAKQTVEANLSKFLRRKADAERQERDRLEAEARGRAVAAQEIAQQAAAQMENDKDLERAIAKVQEARQLQADAAKAANRANESNAKLSQTRGELGSLSSLRTRWIFSELDRKELDLEALRPHIGIDCLEKAVNSFIRAGGRELRGVRIHETTDAVVR